MAQATILLDNQTYTLTAQTAETADAAAAEEPAGSAEPTAAAAAEDDAEITWTCNGEPVDVTGIRDKLAALTAEAFTEEAPARPQLEISLTLDLNDEDVPQVRIQLYRYDGASCLAVLDGEPAALVAREDVVDLMEAVRTLLLG